MTGNVLAGVRTWRWTVLSLGLLSCVTLNAASAADCPGHPDALGTSRVLVVDPKEHPRLGAMQYGETLPLADHEVVLTFDDGPLPHNSDQVLQILADQCIKATFFTIGRMAKAYPENVRKLLAAGHTIGTHSMSHPLTMDRMPIERAQQEIDEGIASTKAALGDDGAALAPFFRIPGLMRAERVENYLASQQIQTWSADFLADDWRHISSARVFELAVKRLEERGKGILLLHDIQARTVAALPKILAVMKERGYRIVHVVPATPERPAVATDPSQWQVHPALETVATRHWPKVPNFVYADTATLPAPAVLEANWFDAEVAASGATDRRRRPTGRESLWPQPSAPAVESTAVSLPVPAETVFSIQEGMRTAAANFVVPVRHAERTVAAEPQKERSKKLASNDDSPRSARGKRHAGRDTSRGSGRKQRVAASKPHGHANRAATHARRGPLKRMVQVKKRNV